MDFVLQIQIQIQIQKMFIAIIHNMNTWGRQDVIKITAQFAFLIGFYSKVKALNRCLM